MARYDYNAYRLPGCQDGDPIEIIATSISGIDRYIDAHGYEWFWMGPFGEYVRVR